MATEGSPKDYGNYELISAQLLLLPTPGNAGQRATHVAVRDGNGPVRAATRRQLSNAYHPYARRERIVRAAPAPVPPLPPPPPPAVSSIGVMDIGQGNCNLLISAANEPLTYFDLGYPLWFFVGSLPNNMRHGNPAYTGPILQNTAGNLNVVLSHWDWDHWRLGRVAGLHVRPWLVPNQQIGPATLAFCNTIALNGTLTVFAGAPFAVYPNYVLHQCALPPGAPAAMVVNNTGIAMRITTNLPTADAVPHDVYMTGDANFNNIQGLFPLNISGIEAVHHGSNNHGAAAGLPGPVAPYAAVGRIFYSYGLRLAAAGYNYAYGFPVPAAVAAYQAAGWTTARSAAEANLIRGLPTTLAHRGNIRVGGAAALNVVYNYSAFAVHTQVLN